MCILDEIKLDISGGKAADSGWDDDVVQCANYEPRYSGKEQEDTQP